MLAATGPDPEPDPIYVLTGGPGSAATGSAGEWSRSPHRERRAIVMMDQRGTGRSNVLDCLFDDDAPVEVYLGQIFDPDHIATCAETLAARAAAYPDLEEEYLLAVEGACSSRRAGAGPPVRCRTIFTTTSPPRCPSSS